MCSQSIRTSVSVVSHNQQSLVVELLNDLEMYFSPDIKVILTLNLSETLTFKTDDYSFPIQIICNDNPKGFGANHNQAFRDCDTPYFCVINPDIRLTTDPFKTLITELDKYAAALIAPKVISPTGNVEDSVRNFPSPWSILKKIVCKRKLADYSTDTLIVNPDWVGGMFMLFKSERFKSVGGFDENYFLYYEDVDICKTLHENNNTIVFSPHTSIIHAARRTSHRNLKYLAWHLKSMLRFFVKWKLKQLLRASA